MEEVNITIRRISPERTILCTDEGKPQLVNLRTRQSSSAPGRLKAVLTIPVPGMEQPEGEEGGPMLPLPFAQAIVGLGYTPEFRLEMN